MKRVLHPEKVAPLPAVAAWLRHADAARLVVRESYPDLNEPELLDVLTRENVVAQLENLKTHPSVAAKLRKGQLKLHGWVYDIASGGVKALIDGTSSFAPLAVLVGSEEFVSG